MFIISVPVFIFLLSECHFSEPFFLKFGTSCFLLVYIETVELRGEENQERIENALFFL